MKNDYSTDVRSKLTELYIWMTAAGLLGIDSKKICTPENILDWDSICKAVHMAKTEIAKTPFMSPDCLNLLFSQAEKKFFDEVNAINGNLQATRRKKRINTCVALYCEICCIGLATIEARLERKRLKRLSVENLGNIQGYREGLLKRIANNPMNRPGLERELRSRLINGSLIRFPKNQRIRVCIRLLNEIFEIRKENIWPEDRWKAETDHSAIMADLKKHNKLEYYVNRLIGSIPLQYTG